MRKLIRGFYRWAMGYTLDPEDCPHLNPGKEITDFGTRYFCRDCGKGT